MNTPGVSADCICYQCASIRRTVKFRINIKQTTVSEILSQHLKLTV